MIISAETHRRAVWWWYLIYYLGWRFIINVMKLNLTLECNRSDDIGIALESSQVDWFLLTTKTLFTVSTISPIVIGLWMSKTGLALRNQRLSCWHYCVPSKTHMHEVVYRGICCTRFKGRWPDSQWHGSEWTWTLIACVKYNDTVTLIEFI